MIHQKQQQASPSSQSGFTIIESLVAVVVVGILLTAIAPVIILSVATRVQARRVELATDAAQTYIDGVRSKTIDPPPTTGTSYTLSRPKTFVSQRKNEGLGRCFGHRVERSLTLAGELIYNPIAQNADDTGILADCIQSARMPQW
jgi:prepilin-type N-terminal cleavage/methylation domain-containing protein